MADLALGWRIENLETGIEKIDGSNYHAGKRESYHVVCYGS